MPIIFPFFLKNPTLKQRPEQWVLNLLIIMTWAITMSKQNVQNKKDPLTNKQLGTQREACNDHSGIPIN